MRRSALCRLLAGMVLLGAGTALAQFSPDSPVGISAGLAKLFGNLTGFSARADVQVLNTNGQETLRSPMNFALLDGKMRMELDMSQMKGASITPQTVAACKQAGLDRVISIVRLDRQKIYLAFAGARSYAGMDMSAADAAAAQKNLQIRKTALGQETIGGHVCVKNRVTVKNARSETLLEAVTWNASDLKDFPVQLSVQSRDNTTVLRFGQVRFARPDAAQFEPPAGYVSYPNPELLVMSAAQKQAAPAATARKAKPDPKSPSARK